MEPFRNNTIKWQGIYGTEVIAKKLMHVNLHIEGKLIKLSFYFNLIIVPSTKCTMFSFRVLK